jgi:uncharacterized membrane protein
MDTNIDIEAPAPAACERGSAFSRGLQNIGQMERWLSLLGGAGLLLYGLPKRSFGGWATTLAGAGLIYRGWTGHCHAYSHLGISTLEAGHGGVKAQRGCKVVRSIHIQRDEHELYEFWRNLANLPRVMRHLEAVTPLDRQRSLWCARGPAGQKLEWEAEVITDRPGEIIAWQSVPGSQVDTAGSVRFVRPTFGEGTELIVTLKYDPPGGRMAAGLAHFVGQGLESKLDEDLEAFKRAMESAKPAAPVATPFESLGGA